MVRIAEHIWVNDLLQHTLIAALHLVILGELSLLRAIPAARHKVEPERRFCRAVPWQCVNEQPCLWPQDILKKCREFTDNTTVVSAWRRQAAAPRPALTSSDFLVEGRELSFTAGGAFVHITGFSKQSVPVAAGRTTSLPGSPRHFWPSCQGYRSVIINMATENLEMNGDADRNGEAEVCKGNAGRRLFEKGVAFASIWEIKSLSFGGRA